MSFQIALYDNKSEPNRLNKNISFITSVQGTIKEDTSIVNPTFLVDISYEQAKATNYIYVSALTRYYFVRDVIFTRGNLIMLVCHTDILMSRKTQILNHSAIIGRNEKRYNMYINDGDIRATQKSNIIGYQLENSFTLENGFYVVGISGKNTSIA